MPTSSDPRAAIVAEARAWLGTPVKPGVAIKGLGVDGWGLVAAVGQACGVLADANAVREALLAIEAAEALPGDLVQLGGHVAILAEHEGRATLIHAPGGATRARIYATGAPAERVVEHGFRDPWPARATGWLRFPGL